jgi:methylated-DNA-[protein]-cysteine S-methyltransferase
MNVPRTFSDKVYDAVRRIPEGSWATYGEIASEVGNPKAARAVGCVLRKNPFTATSGCPIEQIVPCHRVVGADRRLRGFFGDTRGPLQNSFSDYVKNASLTYI